MADLAHDLPLPVERPPPASVGPIGWLRANLFNSVFNTILTLAALYLLAVTIPPIIRWAFLDAIWHADRSPDRATGSPQPRPIG